VSRFAICRYTTACARIAAVVSGKEMSGRKENPRRRRRATDIGGPDRRAQEKKKTRTTSTARSATATHGSVAEVGTRTAVSVGTTMFF
jgi:hypothetical protein